MKTTIKATERPIHRFEAAGLGKAPFRVVSVDERRGPIRFVGADGVQVEIGAPGQPMGTCDYCSQGIAQCWTVESSDGRRFVVGCDCVEKTGDSGMRRTVNTEKRKLQHARDDRRIAAARAALPAAESALRAMASPNLDRPTDTAWDFVNWMFAYAGRAGMVRACRVVESVNP